MELPTYKDALSMSKEALDAIKVPIKVRRARKRAELKMLELEERKATLETELQDLCTKDELNFEYIIEKQDSLGLVERQLKQYAKIIEQMFPE
jgi:hypothetical protein